VIALALLFILSGAAGLIYESVWARYISLLVGHSAYAQVIVLVMFLGGMAIGSLAVGKRSERIRSPLLWYAIVEAVIALIAMVFHPAFVATTNFAYDALLPRLSPGLPVTAATWTLAALLILPQSILLGATFPLMTAGAVRRRGESSGAAIGLLYFANSFGAALGALLGGFLLVERYGLRGTLTGAAILNCVVAAGIGVGFVRPADGRRATRDERPAAVPRPSSPVSRLPSPIHRPPSPVYRLLLSVSFATAFSSFLYEIAWTRMLSLVNGSATHSFEIMLSAFILGLAFGSLWISRFADSSADRIGLLGRMQWLMGVTAIATLPLYLWSFDWMASLLHALADTDAGYRLFSVSRYGIALVIMLPATFCAGTTLPLITKILLDAGTGERAIGAVYGVNTIGSIVGAAFAALVLVPLIGLKWVLIGGGVVDIAVGVALLAWQRSGARRNLTVPLGATLAAIAGLALVTPFAPAKLGSGVFRYKYVPTEKDLRYLFYKDGRTATVGVRQDASDTTSLLVIATNGKPDASMPPAWAKPPQEPRMVLDQDMSTQILLPMMVLVHAPGSKYGAVIGQGSGITSHILLTSPAIEKLHTIEIEPEMIRGSRLFYPGNRRVFDDPRNSFEIDDARAFMAASGQRFDFIVSEPSNPWVSGVSGLFTVEFYERVRKRLNPDGVFVQWFHLYEMDDASVASVIAGIDRVFGDYRLFVSSNSDIIIVASAQGKLPPPDWSVAERFPELAADLRHFAPLTSETLDATIVAGKETLGPFLAEATVNSDFHPILDLTGERSRFRNLFADGFRDLAESPFDVAAALEGRRRPLGTTIENPAPEIVRAAALALGARLRVAKSFEAVEATGDSATRAAETRSLDFQRSLAAAVPPRNWSDWIDEFLQVESDLHGGSAGAADDAFYRSVRAYLARVNAPTAVSAVVDFRHGLAAWDFPEAVRASDTLVARIEGGETWLPVEALRRGAAVARLKTGDAPGAARLFSSQFTLGGDWTVLDRVLQAYIAERLRAGVSPGAASGAPAPLRR
jgi:spermidine synthase/MFS family permease